jgi:hypothetical protein
MPALRTDAADKPVDVGQIRRVEARYCGIDLKWETGIAENRR